MDPTSKGNQHNNASNQGENPTNPSTDGLANYGPFNKAAAEQEVANYDNAKNNDMEESVDNHEATLNPNDQLSVSQVSDILTYTLKAGANPNQVANAILDDEDLDSLVKGNLLSICMQCGAMPTSFGDGHHTVENDGEFGDSYHDADNNKNSADNPEEEKPLDAYDLDDLLKNPNTEYANALADRIYSQVECYKANDHGVRTPTTLGELTASMNPEKLAEAWFADEFGQEVIESGREYVVAHLDDFFAAGADPNHLARTMANYQIEYLNVDGDHASENIAHISHGIDDVIDNADKFIKAGLDLYFLIEEVKELIGRERSGYYEDECNEFRATLDSSFRGDEYYDDEVQGEDVYGLLSRNYDKLVKVGVPANILDDFLHNDE